MKRAGLTIFLACLFSMPLLGQANAAPSGFSVRQVSFPSGDIALSGHLFMPDKCNGCPSVAILHGSGPDDGLGYRVYGEEFARRGIAVLVFDKRGSYDSGGEYTKRSFDLMAGDAAAAVKFLGSQDRIDPGKAGLWGISQGAWTLARAAAGSTEIKFAISVSGNGVSPTTQEMYHKNEMYRRLGYSEKARKIALKFWQLVFDWLVKLDEGRFPVPAGALENERSAASIGLNYDPIPDWERVSCPVLLIHGSDDKLSPRTAALALIPRALKKGGNENLTVLTFSGASHTITTNKTGLEFDWDSHFAPEYFDSTVSWINLVTTHPSKPGIELAPVALPADFGPEGLFGTLPVWGGAYVQLAAFIFFPLFFGGFALYRLAGTFREQGRDRLKMIQMVSSIANLLVFFGFAAFLSTSIFPQGTSLMDSYQIPFWQQMLPWAGNVSTALAFASISSGFLGNARSNLGIKLFACVSLLFVLWLHYWHLAWLAI